MLGYKETEDSEPIILCGTPADVGASCDECPSSCEVPENTILWGAMWNKDFLIDLDVTDPSYDPNDPTIHNDFNDIVRDYNIEIKVNGDREAKPDLEFDPATDSWYFEIPLASVTASLGDDLNAKMKLKRDDGDVNMVTDPDRVEFTIVPNYVLNYDLVGFAGITTGNHCETSGTTGGQGGQAVTVSVGDEESFYDYAKRDGKYIILVNGMLGPPPTCTSGATFATISPSTESPPTNPSWGSGLGPVSRAPSFESMETNFLPRIGTSSSATSTSKMPPMVSMESVSKMEPSASGSTTARSPNQRQVPTVLLISRRAPTTSPFLGTLSMIMKLCLIITTTMTSGQC